MSKYSKEFKLSVVRYYLSGNGYRLTSSKFGIVHSHVERWVKSYKHHGVAGLTMRRRSYCSSFKLEVVKYILENNVSKSEAIAIFMIPAISTVTKWLDLYSTYGIDGLSIEMRGVRHMSKKHSGNKVLKEADKADMEVLLARLEYLEAENACLKKLEALIQEKKKLKQSTKQK